MSLWRCIYRSFKFILIYCIHVFLAELTARGEQWRECMRMPTGESSRCCKEPPLAVVIVLELVFTGKSFMIKKTNRFEINV